jgi:hypothetical protein
MKKLFFLASFLMPLFALTQGWHAVGARSNSLANASVTLNDVWSFHHNPGALGSIQTPTVGVSYENRFLLKELQSQGLAYAHPLKVGVISVGAQFFGYELYRSQRVGMGYSMQFAKRFFAGVQLNYQGLQLKENYGNKNSVTAELGFLTMITNELRLGFSISNLNRSRLTKHPREYFSTNFRLGMSYLLANKVLFLAEASKTVVDPLRGHFAIEYQAINDFYIRVGVATSPLNFTFGVGYKWKFIALDAGSAYQSIVGWSPHVSLTFTAIKKAKE